MAKRVGGIIEFSVNGNRYNVKGNWTYNPGSNKREAVVGADGIHGYKEMPQVAFIEGEVTDTGDLDLVGLTNIVDATAVLGLANGKSFVLQEAWFAGEGTGNTEEGNVSARFEGIRGIEL